MSKSVFLHYRKHLEIDLETSGTVGVARQIRLANYEL